MSLRHAPLAASLAVVLGLVAACAAPTAAPTSEPSPSPAATPSVTPFLMFTGRAEEALTLYTSLFEDGAIVSLERHGPGGGGVEGTILMATAVLGGQRLMVSDSPPVHAFDFTPSTSLFVTCESVAQIDRLFAALSDGGAVMMPLGEYPFARRFGWVADRFGVSWQLSLPLESE